MNIPQQYIVQKFFQYAGFPKYKKTAGIYNGSCPACREGKSWGKKKRLFYIPKDNYIICHNCGRSWSPVKWIMEQGHLTFPEILEDIKDYNSDIFELPKQEKTPKSITFETLPTDSINLFDQQQVNYYKDNVIIQDALNFIKKRRLNTLINRPKALYISLKDFVHKNRLCIPFYDSKGNIPFYQTRAIYKKDEKDKPKYLSKLNSDKTVFGLHNVTPEIDELFIFEGPIDAMGVKNGLATGGIHLSELQTENLKPYMLYTKIWVLDNQLNNDDVKNKFIKLIENGEYVFIWPKKFNQFKDINEICEKYELDQISPAFFKENAFNGVEALMKIKI